MAGSDRPRVLVVEDEVVVAEDICRRLRKLGYEVVSVASTGSGAVQMAVEMQPDMVLMDIELDGEMDGVEAAAQIRAERDVPVIYVTAYSDEALLQRAKDTEPFGYLIKPFKERELRVAIEIALYKHRQEQRLKESEERFRALVTSSSDHVYALSHDGTYLFSNNQVDPFALETSEALTRRHLGEVYPPDVAEFYQAQLMCVYATDQAIGFEHSMAGSGGDRHYLVTLYPIHRNGEVWAVGGISRDITDRKRAEEALRQERDFAEGLIEIAQVIVLVLDTQGRIVRFNPYMERVSGYRLEEVQGEDWFDIFLPKRDRERIRGLFLKAVGDIQTRGNANPIVTKDGRERMVEWHDRILRDSSGNIVGLLAIGQDTTEREHAEEKLQWELSVNTALAELSNALIVTSSSIEEIADVVLDCAKRLTNSEHGYVSSIDQKTGDNVGHTLTTMVKAQCSISAGGERATFPLGRDGRYPSLWGHALNTRDAFFTNSPATHGKSRGVPEGHIPLINFLSVPAVVGDALVGQVALANSGQGYIDRDLEAIRRLADLYALAIQRKRAEEERADLLAQIQEQAQRVHQIVETVPEGVLLLDGDGRVIVANPMGKRDLTTLAGAQVGDKLTHLGNRPLAELLTSPPKGLWHEVTTGSAGDRPGQHGRFFNVIARPIEAGPTPGGWVLVIHEVTREREIHHRVQQQERLAAVGQLAAGIAHDFNNIMAVIALYARMMLRTSGLPAKVRERLEVIDQQAWRASELIQQILDFSRRTILERNPIDLLIFLKEQVKMLERTVPESIQIDLAYDEGEFTVNADPTRIQQAVLNLAVNARDAMPEGGRLRISLDRIEVRDGLQVEDGRLQVAGRLQIADGHALPPEIEAGEWVRLMVADTGTGIPPEALPHIFDPFFTTKSPGEGTGLGLAQVYGIVAAHDGHVDVVTRLGKGTTFIIYLPALSPLQPQMSPIQTDHLTQGLGQLVLVAEDDAATRQALVESLEWLNYRVLETANGREAVALFKRHADQIALVLTDMVMPEMGGRALFLALKAYDPTVKVVMLTGHSLEGEWEDLGAQGLVDCLPKPPALEQLAEVVARALGMA